MRRIAGGKKRDEVQSDPGALPMDDIEMHLLSMRRVYHELYEDPPPPPSPRQVCQIVEESFHFTDFMA